MALATNNVSRVSIPSALSWSPFDLLTVPGNYQSTNGAYVAFLNTYGIWNSGSAAIFDQTVIINFPYSGYYNVSGSCDNYGTIYVDDIEVLSIGGFTSVYSNSFYIGAGNHSVRIYGVNTGGPASIGVTIVGKG